MSFSLSAAKYAASLKIDHTKIDAVLTDFPIAINLDNCILGLLANLGSDKLKMGVGSTDASTQYYVEIECWEEGNHVIHVKIPSVSDSVDTEFTVYWDSTQDDNTDYVGVTGSTAAQNVWDDYYDRVYNMAQNPSGAAPQILDSTKNNYHGSSHGSMTSGDLVSGTIGKGIDLDGYDDYISLPHSVAPLLGSDVFTIECFAQPHAIDDYFHIFSQRNASDNGKLIFRIASNKHLWGGGANASGTWIEVSSPAEIPAYITDVFSVVRTIDSIIIYVSGEAVASISCSINENFSNNGDYVLGRKAIDDSNDYFDGFLYTVRISKAARSDAWIKATDASLKQTIFKSDSYVISGTVKENENFVARTIELHLRATGELVSSITSDPTTGAYSFPVYSTEEYYIVVLDDDSGTQYNAKILDRMVGV